MNGADEAFRVAASGGPLQRRHELAHHVVHDAAAQCVDRVALLLAEPQTTKHPIDLAPTNSLEMLLQQQKDGGRMGHVKSCEISSAFATSG